FGDRASRDPAPRRTNAELRAAQLHQRSDRRAADRARQRPDLAAWRLVQGYALEIRYTGQRTPQAMVELLGQSLTLSSPRAPAVEHRVRARTLPDRNTVYFLPQRKQIQTQLLFVVDGEPVAAEQYGLSSAARTDRALVAARLCRGSAQGVARPLCEARIRRYRGVLRRASGRATGDHLGGRRSAAR